MRKKSETVSLKGNGTRPAAFPFKPFQAGLLGGLGVLLALTIGTIVTQLGTVLLYVGIALFLALGLDPVVSFLERKMPRPAAIAVVVFTALGIVAGVLLAVIPTIIKQVEIISATLPKFIEDVQQAEWFKDLLARYDENISDAINGALAFISDPTNLLSIGGNALQTTTTIAGGIANAITGIIVVLILTLYFMASLRTMKTVAARFVPAYRRTGFSDVLEDVSNAVGRYVIGQVTLASINGVLTLVIGFVLALIFNSPSPVLLAIIAFIGSCIPMVGTLSASIINTSIVVISALVGGGSLTPGIIFGIWYLVYMQVEAYILNPRIMSKAVSVPGAVIVVAAVGGAAIGGVLGALVAVPIAASVLIIIQKVVWPTQDRKVSEGGELEVVVTDADAEAKA